MGEQPEGDAGREVGLKAGGHNVGAGTLGNDDQEVAQQALPQHKRGKQIESMNSDYSATPPNSESDADSRRFSQIRSKNQRLSAFICVLKNMFQRSAWGWLSNYAESA